MVQNTFKIFNAIVYTIRPYPCLGACLLVYAGFDPSKGEWDQTLLLMTATFFGSAFCFLLNDLFDRKKDLLNNKKRPLATGELPVHVALTTAVLFACVFLASTWFLGTTPFLLSFLFLVITSTYSFVNRKTGLMANIIVAFVVSGTQWGVAILKPDGILWASSIFLFFYTIPREILLDWLDMKGDKAYGKHSVPIDYSLQQLNFTIIVSLIFASAAIIGAIYFYLPNTLSILLAVSIIVSAWFSFLPFFKTPDRRKALESVRWSHVTFAFLIFTLISR